MDALLPRVAERLDLLDLAGGVLNLAVLDVTLSSGHLPIGAEFDPVRRIHIDHLDLATEAFLLRKRRHHLQAVT